MNKHKRVVLYITEDKYNQLRSKLILLGQSVSGWFRSIVDKFLKN